MATSAAILDVLVRADTDQATRAIRTYQSQLKRTDQSITTTTRTTSGLSKATSNVGSRLKSAAGYAAGAAAAYLSISQAKAAITTTQDLAKTTAGLNRNLGLTVKEGSRWASVAKSRDVDAKALTLSFTTLSRRLVDTSSALKEGGSAADTAFAPFKRLGISQKEVVQGSKDLDEFLPKLADAFGGAAGGAERQASAQQLLGRGYSTILPLFADGAKGLKEQQMWADKYGTTLNSKTLKAQMDLVSAQRESKVAWLGIQVAFAKFLTPALEKANEEFQKISAIMADDKLTNAEKWEKVGDIIAKWADKAFDAFVGILPRIAEKAAEHAPKIAEALVKGFLNAPILGQLVLGGWLLKAFGGMGAIGGLGTTIGTKLGMSLGGAAGPLAVAGIASALAGAEVGKKLDIGQTDIGEKIADELGIGLEMAQKVTRYMENHPGLGAPEALAEMRQAARLSAEGWERFAHKIGDNSKDAGQKTEKAFRSLGKGVDKGLEFGQQQVRTFTTTTEKDFSTVSTSAKRMKDAVTTSVGSMAQAVGQGFKRIGSQTNKALAAFGVKPVAFAIGEGIAAGDTQNKQVGGVIVPGQGSGDKVHAMLEPGEVVLNRTAVAAMGGADRANSINRKIPRFAKGGKASKGTPQWDAMVAMANKFEAADEPYLLGGGHGGFLSSPAPVDCSGFVSAVLHAGGLLEGAPMVSGALASSWGKPGSGPLTVYANDGHTFMSLDGNFYGTSQSNPGGGAGLVEGGYDAGYISGFVKKTMDVAAGAIGGAAQIARQVLKGPDGPLKDIGQGALDKVRGAANKYISSKMPAGTAGGGDAEIGAPIKSLPKALTKYNKQYPGVQYPSSAWQNAYQMPHDAIAALAEWAGAPGETMYQVNLGEGASRPGSWSIDPGGGSRGYGLWAITQGVGNDAMINSFGGVESMWNPAINAQAMAKIWASSGQGAWYGIGHVTDWNSHYSGPLLNQEGGIVQKLAEGGIVGAFDQMIDRVRTRDDAEERQDAIKNFLDRVKAIKLAAKRMQEVDEQRGIFAEAVQWESVGGDKAEFDDLGNLIPGSDTAHGHGQEVWLNKQLDALFELRNQLVMAGEILARKEAEVRKVLERARKHLKKVQKEVDKAQKERKGIQDKVDAVKNEEDARDFLHWLHDEETGKAQPSRPLLEFIHDQLGKKNPAKGLDQVMDLITAPEGPKRVVDALESGIIEKLDTKAASLHTAFEASRDSSEGLEWIQGIHGNLHDLFNKKNRPKPGILAGEIWAVQQRIKDLKPVPPEPDTPLELLQVQEAIAASTPTLTDDIAVQQQYVQYWTGELSRLLGSGGSAVDISSAYDAISSARDLIEQLRADQFTSASTPSLEELLGFQRGGVIPAFAEGGTMARTGWALVGEKGPEIVKLQQGDEVIPNSASTASYPKPTDWAFALPPREVIENFLNALRTARILTEASLQQAQTRAAFPSSPEGIETSRSELSGQLTLMNTLMFHYGRLREWLEAGINSPWVPASSKDDLRQERIDLVGHNGQGGDVLTLQGQIETVQEALAAPVSTSAQLELLESKMALAGLTETLSDDIYWQGRIVDYWEAELSRLQQSGAAPSAITQAASSLRGARDTLKGLEETTDTTVIDRLEANLALAGLTPTLSDDINWQRQIVDYWRGELARLQDIGASSPLIGSAAQSLLGARTALETLEESQASQSSKLARLEMKFALAQLTETLADDIKWQREIVGYWADELKRLRRTDAPPEQIASAAQSLLGARDTLKGLLPEDTTEQQKADLLSQLLQQANLRFAVSQAQYGVLGAFAQGGVASSSGMYLVGENGPERAYLPQGTTVVPGTGEVQVVINGDIHQAAGDRRPPVQVTGAPEDIVRRGARGYGRRPAPGAVGR